MSSLIGVSSVTNLPGGGKPITAMKPVTFCCINIFVCQVKNNKLLRK